MTVELLLVLLVGTCLLGTLAVGLDATVREKKKRKHVQERLKRVTAAYGRETTHAVMGRSSIAVPTPVKQALTAAAGVFGYDPVNARHYPVRWWIVLIVAFIVARLISELFTIFLGAWSLLVVPAAWIMLSRFVFHWSERRRSNALYVQLPDALAMIVRAVRVGIPLGEGIRTVAREAPAPTGPEFASLHDRIAIGVSLEDALREMAGRNKITEYRFFATVISLQSQTGGGLAEALEGLGDVIRRRLALKARGQALAAEAKTSIFILASLPFVSGGALAVLNPAYIGRLVTDHGCVKVLIAAIVLLSSGLLVMRAMIRSALS
jgi:tight adherence protein B